MTDARVPSNSEQALREILEWARKITDHAQKSIADVESGEWETDEPDVIKATMHDRTILMFELGSRVKDALGED